MLKSITETVDVVVAGGGTAGHIAALQAARAGVRTSDRIAFAGIRAQCTCMAMGQAMGAAAALAIKKGVPSREIPAKEIVAVTVEHGAVSI